MDCTSESASHYAGCECNEEHWREQLATAVAARDNWIETARMHAKNEAYYRNLIVTALACTPAAFVSDDGSIQQDVLCGKLPELYATAVAAREEAEADIARLERLHAACDATIRGLTNKALAAVRGQEAAEARAERLTGVDAAARGLFDALDYVTPGWRADTCVVHGDEVNRAWFELEKKLGQGPDAALAEEERR